MNCPELRMDARRTEPGMGPAHVDSDGAVSQRHPAPPASFTSFRMDSKVGTPADALGASWPKNELDKTPRSEEPPPCAPAERTQPETGYFSPRPVRPYGGKLPSSTPGSARPSPTSSIESPSPSPAGGHFRRPSVYRDDSNASTTSVATVRAHSVDPSQLYTAAARHQLDGPYYPNQSYAALQSQPHPAYYFSSSARKGRPHQGHSSSLSAAHIRTHGLPHESHRDVMDSGSRTVGNSPVGSPGLFNPGSTTPPLRHVRQLEDGSYSSPYLHHTHRQAPKETHVADVDVDPISGRKIINQYEVMDELGRGVHGKVKLGRNLATNHTVAIKIVDRYSKKRRLNKDTSHEDKIKREIAILKKARHPNIVSLLEVIDDPSRKKVYIVLEHVELGEVRWRTEGEKEICLIEWRRYQRESQGVVNQEAAMEDEQIIHLAHQKLAVQQRKQSQLRRLRQAENAPWSLEHGGDSEDEIVGSLGSMRSGRTSRASTRSAGEGPDTHRLADHVAKKSLHQPTMETAVRSPAGVRLGSHDADASTELEGTMYGAYDSDLGRDRTPSIAGSSSSQFSWGGDDFPLHLRDRVPEHFRYVPLLTLQAALETFRDTVLGLEFLHFQEVVHRDIKPANLLQTKEHRIKISDFGVSYLGRARRETDDPYASESDMQDAEAIELAKTVGTPAFYAPELCKLDDDGDPLPVTKAIDIWALGVTLYCLIYGRVPFYEQNEFKLMRMIVEEEVFIPQFRLKAVAEQSGSRPSSHGRMYQARADNKRLPHELEYEQVPELLRDLLRRLLIKDPRRRISIAEIKRHPWVLQGLESGSWMEETDPERTSQGRRIEVSKDDMEQAVVPVTFVDKMRSGMRKTMETIVGMSRIGARGGSRKRAESAATSPDPSAHSMSLHSSSSTLSQGQESRRPSLALSQSIFETLSRSRESEHPLSHSVSASPEARERGKFFEQNSRTASPAHGVDTKDVLAAVAQSARPVTLERGYSDMSSAASIRTIKQSDVAFSTGPLSPRILPSRSGPPTAMDPPTPSGLSGLLGGVPRLVSSMRSRERLPKPSKRQPEPPKATSETAEDPHSCPSVALSTAIAAGHVDTPDPLRDLPPSMSRSQAVSTSEIRSTDPIERAASRQSSVSAASSYFNIPVYTSHEVEPTHGADPYMHPVHQQEVTHEGFQQAKDELYRQRVAEENESREKQNTADVHQHPLPSRPCPPSPDDLAPAQGHKVQHYLKNGQDLASSSSDDFLTSLSQSTSNPSIPSVISAGSSVATDDYSRVSSTYAYPRTMLTPSNESLGQLSEATDYDGDGDQPLESDDEDSDDDFLVMSRKKPTAAAARSSVSISNAEFARKDVRKAYQDQRRRSARSGSNGTVKKISIPVEPAIEKGDP